MSDIHEDAMVSVQNALLIYFINILHQQMASATPEAFMTNSHPTHLQIHQKKVKLSFTTRVQNRISVKLQLCKYAVLLNICAPLCSFIRSILPCLNKSTAADRTNLQALLRTADSVALLE